MAMHKTHLVFFPLDLRLPGVEITLFADGDDPVDASDKAAARLLADPSAGLEGWVYAAYSAWPTPGVRVERLVEKTAVPSSRSRRLRPDQKH